MKHFLTVVLFTFSQVVYTQYCEIDSTFDYDGWKITSVTPSEDYIEGLIPLSDGKLIAVGPVGSLLHFDIGMVKYNEDGSLDETFGTDGIFLDAPETASLVTYDARIQDDTHFIVGGSWYEDGNKDIFISKFDFFGIRDVSFGIDGYVHLDLGDTDEKISSLAMQDDGKIYAAGRTFTGANSDWFVARFNINGTLDTIFGNNGIQLIDITETGYNLEKILVQADGKIVCCGNTPNMVTGMNIVCARLTNSGILDTTFNHSGIFEYDLDSTYDLALSMAIQNDGKLIIAGISESYGLLLRMLAGGVIDSSFGNNGAFLLPNASFASILLDEFDQIIAIGNSHEDAADVDFCIYRIKPNGTLDSTFGNFGRIASDLGQTVEVFVCAAWLYDGKIVSGGYSRGINSNFAVGRYIYGEKVTVPIDYTITKQLHIYPNPTNGSIKIQGELRSGCTVNIINLAGKIITTISNAVDAPEIDYTFDKSIPNGIYFVEIIDNKSKILSSAFILSR